MDRTTFAIESFKNIQDLIRFVDQKASAVLVVTGLIFTGYVKFLSELTLATSKSITLIGVLVFITSLVTAICLIMVISIIIFKVLNPRNAKHYKSKELSLFYYEHIFQMGKAKIYEKYKTIDEETILKNITDQQYEVSNILKEKTNDLGKSLKWLFFSIVSVMIFIILSNLI